MAGASRTLASCAEKREDQRFPASQPDRMEWEVRREGRQRCLRDMTLAYGKEKAADEVQRSPAPQPARAEWEHVVRREGRHLAEETPGWRSDDQVDSIPVKPRNPE